MYFADRSCSICVVSLPMFLLVTSYWLRCHLSSTMSQVNPTKDLDAEFDVILAADVIYPTTGGSLPLLLQILSQ